MYAPGKIYQENKLLSYFNQKVIKFKELSGQIPTSGNQEVQSCRCSCSTSVGDLQENPQESLDKP
jgi:hypothetical protein